MLSIKDILKNPLAWVIAFFIISRLLALYFLPFFVGDEANYVHSYFEFEKTGRPDIYGEFVHKPPGMFAMTSPMLNFLVPMSNTLGLPIEVPFRLVSLIFGIPLLYLVYKILLELSGSVKGAAVGTMFFSVFPNYFYSSLFYYPDTFVLLSSLLAFYFLVKMPNTKGSAIAALFTGLAFYIKLEQAFLIFLVALPFMLLRRKLRLEYFVFSGAFCLLAIVLITAPYYPARMSQFMLLVQTELFTRVSSGTVPSPYLLFFIHLPLAVLVPFCLIYSLNFMKGADFNYEYVETAMLLAFLAMVSAFFYSALLYVGLLLLISKIYSSLTTTSRGLLFALLAFTLVWSFLFTLLLCFTSAYDFQSQKDLGVFLQGKYPLTIVSYPPTMEIWRYYTAYYLPQNSPVLLANIRMSILAYKFFGEANPDISQVHAFYVDGNLTGTDISNITLTDKYVVVEAAQNRMLAPKLQNYTETKQFGTVPGFILYEKSH